MNDWKLSKDAYDLLLDKLTDIESLVRAQNGRVRRLESWRNRLIGAWGVFTVFLMIVAKKMGLW